MLDLELSFCNEGLKAFVIDIQDRYEAIQEERQLCSPDDKAVLTYLLQLEMKLETQSKLVEELLRYCNEMLTYN